MTKPIAALLLLAATALVAPAVSAQTLSKTLRESRLTPGDFEAMDAAGRALYETAAPQVGKTVSWSNPESGSQGTARLDAMDGACATLLNTVQPGGDAPARSFRQRMCKAASGQWVLTP